MTTFTWLHLSDLHVGMRGADDYWPNVEEDLYEDLSFLLSQGDGLDLVVFSGDLAQSGQAVEFDEVTRRLERLWEELLVRRHSVTPPLFAVPGNHDLVWPDRRDPRGLAFRSVWSESKDFRDEFWIDQESAFRSLVREAFAEYERWWEELDLPKPPVWSPGMLPGDMAASVEKEGLRFGILGLNTAFRQLWKGDLKGRMELHIGQFHAATNGNGPQWATSHDASLLVTHHPPSWLSAEGRRHLTEEIYREGRFVVQLFGHMHEANLTSVAEGGGRGRRFVQGYSLFGMEGWGEDREERIHGYLFGQIEVRDRSATLRFFPRRAFRREGRGWLFERDGQGWTLPKGAEATHPLPLELRRRAEIAPVCQVRQPAATTASEPPPSTASVLHNVPLAPAAELRGREAEMAILQRALLADDGPTVANITGLRGIGRTSLARQIAAQAIRNPSRWDGVVWLGPRRGWPAAQQQGVRNEVPSRRPLDDLVHAIGEALQSEMLRKAKLEERGEIAREVLATGRHLLVLDDADQMNDPGLAAFLADLPPGNKVLAISVHPLPYSEFTQPLRPVPGLSTPAEVQAEPNGWVLAPQQVRLLKALVLYPEPVAAEALAHAGGVDPAATAAALDSLVDTGILAAADASGCYLPRHPRLEDWAAARLATDPGFVEEATVRSIEYLLGRCEEAARDGSWASLAGQLGNQMWAARRSLEIERWEVTLRFRTTLGQFLHDRGYFNEAILLGDWVFTAADMLGRHIDRAWAALYPLARAHFYQHSFRLARLWARRGLAIFEQQDDRFGTASACRYLGRILHAEDDRQAAAECFERGLKLAGELAGSRLTQDLQAGLYESWSALALDLADYRAATSYQDRALALYQRTGNRQGRAEVLRLRAETMSRQGSPEWTLVPLLRQAVEATSSERQRAVLRVELAERAERSGDRQTAVEQYRLAILDAQTAAASQLEGQARQALARLELPGPDTGAGR